MPTVIRALAGKRALIKPRTVVRRERPAFSAEGFETADAVVAVQPVAIVAGELYRVAGGGTSNEWIEYIGVDQPERRYVPKTAVTLEDAGPPDVAERLRRAREAATQVVERANATVAALDAE